MQCKLDVKIGHAQCMRDVPGIVAAISDVIAWHCTIAHSVVAAID
jgi:hypothetical protein